jgi:aerobic-type carbon monoxide dehydrogenase small subunit (CoxS/CutS family)
MSDPARQSGRAAPPTVELFVNGERVALAAEARKPLLGVLREDLGLTGSKIGCGEGECGACTVLVEDQPVRSCVTPVGDVAGRRVTTIEGLARDGRLHPLQSCFVDEQAFQCGYCTPGMIMSALALLTRDAAPSEEAIVRAMQGNICRCGTYSRVIRAIRRAADEIRRGSPQGGAT